MWLRKIRWERTVEVGLGGVDEGEAVLGDKVGVVYKTIDERAGALGPGEGSSSGTESLQKIST